MTNQNDDPNGCKQPSLCVLLHGSLKVENMVAICKIGEPNWYGILYSWADNKKKSNLMLSTLKYGADSINWLGNLNHLGLSNLDNKISLNELNRFGEKKSYAQNCTVWVKNTGLCSDIQKVLRLAKKIPEKQQNFTKELTKFKKAALTIGFYSILEGMSAMLERERTLLSNNPMAQQILQESINFLRL